MPAGIYDLYIEQGATFGFTVNLTNADGTVYDLTGYDARSMIRRKYTDAQETESFTTVVTYVPNTTSSIALSLTPAETAAIAAGNYVWDLEIFTNQDADVKRLLQGSVTVSPEATKP